MATAPDFIPISPQKSAKAPDFIPIAKAAKPATEKSGAEIWREMHPQDPDSPFSLDYLTKKAIQLTTDENQKISPVGALKAVGKTLASATDQMASLAAQGIAGLASVALGEGFEAGQQKTAAAVQKILDYTQKISGLNLSAVDKQDQAAADLLNIIPKAITATGDDVFEKIGSALAGAGTQALLALLSFKPTIASKVIGGVTAGVPKPAAALTTNVFDELAVKAPEAADAIAEHVAQADPKQGEVLKERAKEAQKKEEPIIGEDVARAKVEPAQIFHLYRGVEQKVDINRNFDDAQGIHFTDDKDMARAFAGKGGKVHEADVTFKNPYVTTNAYESAYITSARRAELEAKGYDGVIGTTLSGKKEFIPFDPSQIKPRGDSKLEDIVPIPGVHRLRKSVATEIEERFKVAAVPRPPEAQAADMRTAVKEGYETLAKPSSAADQHTGETPADIVYFNSGIPVTRQMVSDAFTLGKAAIDKIPGSQIVQGKLAMYWEEFLRNVAPESLGPEAKTAGSTIAKAIAEQMQYDSTVNGRGQGRMKFWNEQKAIARDFIERYETKAPMGDPILEKAAANYRVWNAAIDAQDKRNGISYEAREDYLSHIFEDKKALDPIRAKYGKKWGDPFFMKDRTFDTYEEAIKNGFKPKYTNPEELMQARQHASNIAGMKVQVLRDLEKWGLAKKMTKDDSGAPVGYGAVARRSPNGDWYWVHEKAHAVVENAFDSKTLWNAKGLGGDLFRGGTFLKNSLIPFKLGFSAFHGLHVLTIDNATGMVRASKELLAGDGSVASVGKFFNDFGSATIYRGIYKNPKMGSRINKLLSGRLPESEITDADRAAFTAMAEGGYIPGLPEQYRTSAIKNFTQALQRGSPTVLWHAPFAAMQLLQRPMFEKWIPALKTASYLHDVEAALKADPSLLDNPLRRQNTFRRLAKSIDNRYGEMAYNTLFWNRWIKDIGVGTSLSLGWNLGFVREYGGGLLDIGQWAKEGGFKQKVVTGQLDRPMFITFYTAQAMLYGGLMTWALTGKPPTALIDYFYPQTGDQGKDGKPLRASTMFYTREFAGTYKHMQNEGVVEGLKDTVVNKGSGMIGLVREFATGVNDMGDQMRNPEHPPFKQVEEQLLSSLPELEPISLTSFNRSQVPNKVKAAVLSVAGVSPAPAYATQSSMEARIGLDYDKYVKSKEKPYEAVLRSKDYKKLKEAYDKPGPEYDRLLDKFVDDYKLEGKDVVALQKRMARDEDFDVTAYLFSRLPRTIQDEKIAKMTKEEKERFIPHLSKRRQAEIDW
jgi:hypothetical protein